MEDAHAFVREKTRKCSKAGSAVLLVLAIIHCLLVMNLAILQSVEAHPSHATVQVNIVKEVRICVFVKEVGFSQQAKALPASNATNVRLNSTVSVIRLEEELQMRSQSALMPLLNSTRVGTSVDAWWQVASSQPRILRMVQTVSPHRLRHLPLLQHRLSHPGRPLFPLKHQSHSATQ